MLNVVDALPQNWLLCCVIMLIVVILNVMAPRFLLQGKLTPALPSFDNILG